MRSRLPGKPGIYNICYISGFQAQADEDDSWLNERLAGHLTRWYSRGMSRSFAGLVLAFGLVGAESMAAPPGTRRTLDRVVAVVNEEVVLASDLNAALRREGLMQEALRSLPDNATAQQIEQKRNEVRVQVLDDLLERCLIRAEAKKFQITVAEPEVEKYLKNLVASSQLKDTNELKETVETSGEYGTWEDYKTMLRDDILQYKTVMSLAHYSVTDAQIREHYRKMTRDENAKVELERYVFTPDAQDSRARDEAFAQAQNVARRLRAGQPSAQVAADLGIGVPRKTVGRGEIAPALEDAIFAAKVNEVVGPLASGQGYVVFKIIEQRASVALDYDQVKDKIRDQLEQEAMIKAEQEFRQELRAKAHIDIRL